MLVRFGFVAMSMTLEDASPSKTVTQKTYRTLMEQDPEAALDKVKRIARENVANSLRLLHHCYANHIKLYRFSSKIIPLATHPELSHWDYIKDLQEEFKTMGRFIREQQMRVTFHPDHYTLINSPKEEVFEAAVVDFAHHCRLFNAMELDSTAKLITHVGGGYNNKEAAMERFLDNWARLPTSIAMRITLENDDKTFTAQDTLYLCDKLQIPLVLDIHHFHCNHEEDSTLEQIFPRFLATWQDTDLPPKIHISSPKCETDIRSHHDYIDANSIYPILMSLRQFNTDIDAMVEAKQKDKAMFKLVRELGSTPGIEQIDPATIRIL